MIIRVGTRKSTLAMVQTKLVVKEIRKHNSNMKCEIVPLTTIGDRIRNKPLVAFGGKGAFVSEFEEALKKGVIDLAVHSAKDMPTELEEGLEIVAALPRGDVRDVLVTRKGKQEMPHIIGSSSLRRKIQIQKRYPVICEELRGNVQTRLKKLEEGQYDGIILAAAGLERLGIKEGERYTFTYLDAESFIPAGGQAIIAVEGRKKDLLGEELRRWSDKVTMRCLETERLVLHKLQAGCQDPVGVYAKIIEDKMQIRVMWQDEIIYKVEGKQACYRKLVDQIVDRIEGR